MSNRFSTPKYCPVCKSKAMYYGRIVFAKETGDQLCPNHEEGKQPILISAVRKR